MSSVSGISNHQDWIQKYDFSIARYFERFQILKTKKMLIAHTLFFGLLSLVYSYFFSRKNNLIELDSTFNATLSNYHLDQMGKSIALKSDFLFGNGTMQWGYNFPYEPTALFGSFLSDIYNPMSVALSMSILLFVAAFKFFETFKLENTEALVASYVLSISSVWGIQTSMVDYVFPIVPQYASLLIVLLSFLSVFRRVGFGGLRDLVFFTLCLCGISFYAISVFPQIIVTSSFLFIATIGGSILPSIANRNYKLLRDRALCLLAVAIFMWAVGAHKFLEGFYLNSAAAEVPVTPFNHSSMRNLASFFSQTFFPYQSRSPIVIGFKFTILVLLVVFVVRGILGKSYRSELWFSALIAAICLICYRVLQRDWVFERGPNHTYLSWMLGPLYAAGLSVIIIWLGRGLAHKIGFSWTQDRRWMRHSLGPMLIPVSIIILVFVPYSSSHLIHDSGTTVELKSLFADPILTENISLTEDTTYRGRAVFIKQEPDYAGSINSRIPILNDYSHTLSPSAFLFYKQFLFDDSDLQRRNHIVFSAKNLDIYRLLGVRYLITKDLDLGLSVTDANLVSKSNSLMTDNYLFEIDEVNVGNFSPTIVVHASSMLETFKIMSSANFSVDQDLVLQTKIREDLVPAISASLEIINGDLRLRAESLATSIIVLPLEFSHCLKFIEKDENSGFLGAQIGDGFLTAVMFEKTLDLDIRFRFGLLGNSGCRLRDLNEFRDFSKQSNR